MSVMGVESAATASAAEGYSEEAVKKMSTDELWETYRRTGDVSLKWALVLRYQDLVKNAALQVRGVYKGFAQMEDIIGEGVFALFHAIDKFDPDKGCKFETYISKRIRGMVIDLARRQDWLPRNVRKRARDIDEAVSALSSELGRFPNDTEVAELLGVSESKYQKDMADVALSNILSLDALLDSRDKEGYQFGIASRDEESQPEAALLDTELQQQLAAEIGKLRENEQQVLSLYYEKNLRMKEIAQVLDVSEPRVSQIHARAIQKLRLCMEAYLNDKMTTMEPRSHRKES